MSDKKYKAIIFDLDGVICNIDDYYYLAWEKIANQIGVGFDKELYQRIRGFKRMEALNIILESYKGDLEEIEKEILIEDENEYFQKSLGEINVNNLSKEVNETLLKIKKMDMKMAIASSSKNARFILERIGLNFFFDAISDGNNIKNLKPDPEVFIKAADFLCLKPKECVVVEHSDQGIEGAYRGGFDCIGLGDVTENSKANFYINSFKEILDCI